VILLKGLAVPTLNSGPIIDDFDVTGSSDLRAPAIPCLYPYLYPLPKTQIYFNVVVKNPDLF
jgi:hypothetical protein